MKTRKYVWLSIGMVLLCAMQIACQQTSVQFVDRTQIEETVNGLFIGVDERDWTRVKNTMSGTVLLDYTSMAGGKPATLAPDAIIDSWKGILPGFDATHHQLGNFVVTRKADAVMVFCYGTATHYLKNKSNNNVWAVVGTYEFVLKKVEGLWKISSMKFDLKYIDGNTSLPSLAMDRAKGKK
ncbi:MAG TPA: nuclear transport factor 2 family protein [Spirochaetota bacterium]|nr:nuclear transport factor 2 family protein [Spirochaetota bacterium]HPU89151.1 nuclear transport factor 2 family protein [Spirochaetota bacterium]